MPNTPVATQGKPPSGSPSSTWPLQSSSKPLQISVLGTQPPLLDEAVVEPELPLEDVVVVVVDAPPLPPLPPAPLLPLDVVAPDVTVVSEPVVVVNIVPPAPPDAVALEVVARPPAPPEPVAAEVSTVEPPAHAEVSPTVIKATRPIAPSPFAAREERAPGFTDTAPPDSFWSAS
jgi:hypothetical protein